MTDIISAAAIAKVFPEGQKTVAYVLEYGTELAPGAVAPEAFTVTDASLAPQVPAAERTILRAYVNDRAACAETEKAGRYVILETDPSQKQAFAIVTYGPDGKPDPFGPGPMSYAVRCPGGPRPGGPGKAPGQPGPRMGYCGPKPQRVTIRQNTPLTAAGGRTLPAGEIECEKLLCPETDRFQLRRFGDLPYNLFIPEDYDPTRRYPLVLFVPDAGGRGADPRTPLLQGIGGVVWASPEDQAKHPCFVVCPAFGPADILTRDDFTCMEKLYTIKPLLEDVIAAYSIDTDRIYTTGQSMGCMTSCELMNAYPDFFAGALLVAGQWDPARCGRTMHDKDIWILVSCNDLKAHPGMDAVTAAIEANGGRVARFGWDAAAGPEALNAMALEALQTDANVRYTVFDGDSVVPPGEDPNPGSNHTCTWRTAYAIPAVRDWLFTARRRH